jgi:hypothetical protein
MKVNGKTIKTYSLDTMQSITVRIASVLKTVPRYLVWDASLKQEMLKNSFKGKYTITDLLNMIKEDAKTNIDFSVLLENIENIYSGKDIKNLVKPEDILPIWLCNNTELIEIAKTDSDSLYENVSEGLTKVGITKSEFKKAWKESVDSCSRLTREISSNERLNKSYEDVYIKFEEIEEGVAYTPFKIEKIDCMVNFEVYENNKNSSIDSMISLYNSVITNIDCPFVYQVFETENDNNGNGYYKILKSVVPPDTWLVKNNIKTSKNIPIENNDMLLKVNDRLSLGAFGISSISSGTNKEYSDVLIRHKNQNSFSMFLGIPVHKAFVDIKTYISRGLSVFQNVKVIEEVETGFISNFYFPQEYINSYVFADLVMSNKIFSSLINIDESAKTTKRRSADVQPVIYIHFSHPSTGEISASIVQKFVTAPLKDEDPEIFPLNSGYIKVRAKAGTSANILAFQEMFSKLLVLYNSSFEDIVEIYKEYIPDFGVIFVEEGKESKHKLDQSVFVKKYSRICGDKRIPTVYNEIPEGKDYAVFPRDKIDRKEVVGDSSLSFPSDGVNQKYYVCENPEFPFVGLQQNKLENSDEYPYLPCCFKTDQKNKKSLYRKYYYGEEIVKSKKQQEIIITDKFVDYGKFGTLPAELNKLFISLDEHTGYEYVRTGTNRGYSSFLEAVMIAVKNGGDKAGNKGKKKNEDITEDDVKQTRKKLSNKDVAPLCRQSMYDTDIQTCISYIQNLTLYLDPVKYIQLLEGYFDCNIFLFSKESLLTPLCTQGFYKYKRNSFTVLILEHLGSESDHAKYPQCELIVKRKVGSTHDIQYTFPKEQKISRKIKRLYELYNSSYVFENKDKNKNKDNNESSKLKEIEFGSILNENITSQYIDSMGKTRIVKVKSDEENDNPSFVMYTDPIPPLQVEEVNIKEMYTDTLPKLEHILGYFMNNEGEITGQSVKDKKVIEIKALIGNVSVYIPVFPTSKIMKDIPLYKSIHKGGKNDENDEMSVLQNFNRNRKIARYISEYVYWMFSRFLYDTNITSTLEITDKVINSFSKKGFVIKPNFAYPDIPKDFTVDSAILENGRVIVHSEDMLKRLVYMIRIMPKNILLDYKNNKSISNYYLNIPDFDVYPQQIILRGVDMVEKWIHENNASYALNDSIMIGNNNVYFFKNKLIGDTVYIAQNATSMDNALDISNTWNKEGYNCGNFDCKGGVVEEKEGKGKEGFTLHNYIDSTSIESFEVKGDTEGKDTNIVGYKIEDKVYYTVLLS